ncbi:Ppx/GppA phosphatase family protein [Parvibaculaceae bacterium PLY_AMNH_Bact1]|nr:Ppx/GppA phosphatase family protein [Parvibaculaceae bacterium PLY_AMNH_Bact1]
MTDTGDRSQAASGEAAASRSDAGPVEGSNGIAGQTPGVDAARDDAAQPKKRRRRRRRRKKASKSAAETSADSQNQPQDSQAERSLQPKPQLKQQSNPQPKAGTPKDPPVYAAIDLGTNNCRLLVAKRSRDGFRVIDAYSRIVRLGEGLASTGQLSDDAMDRAAAALKICADKMKRRGVTRARSIATEACRTAANGTDFIARVVQETGIELDIVSTADEAQLAVGGCAPLLDPSHAAALVFDIGGGSTELMWVHHEDKPKPEILDWTSLPCGVVTLAETYGGDEVSEALYQDMVADVAERLAPFKQRLEGRECDEKRFHLLGTSGTVTTIAGVHLGLKRYDRSQVDGAWVSLDDVSNVTQTLLGMTLAERAAHSCVGQERADLVLAGCAILDAISQAWPADRLRVADRGLREGILFSLMEADQTRGSAGRRRRRRRRRRKSQANQGVSPSAGETKS